MDLNRARAFYEGALGLTVEDVNDFACVLRGAGTMLRVTKVDSLTPQPFTVLGWAVEDIHAVGSALRSRGLEFLRFEGLQQDELGVWSHPAVGGSPGSRILMGTRCL